MDGLVHIYAGEGKGKTTAAIGICTRISGWGKKAAFYEFLKGSDTGEAKALSKLGVKFYCPVKEEKFVFAMNLREKEICALRQKETLLKAQKEMQLYDLVVLDEALSAIEAGVLDVDCLISAINNKPPKTELVLTGRQIPPQLMPYADYVSVINAVKHPYDKGIAARQGIEY